MKRSLKNVFISRSRISIIVSLISILVLILGACSSDTSEGTNDAISNTGEGINLNIIDYSEGLTVNYGTGISGLQTQNTELLANSGFNTNSDWFNCGNAANYTIANGVLELSATSCVYQTVAATPNTNYNLACDSTSSAAFSNVTLSMLDANYNAIVTDGTLVNDETAQPAVQLSLESPSNTTYVAVTMYSEGPARHESCSLITESTPTPTPPAPTPPAPTPDGELLANSGFNTNSDWFNCGNAANYAIANGVLELSGTSSCVYQTVAATPNTTYNLVCDSTSSAAFSNVTLSMLDSNYSTIIDDISIVDDRTAQPSVQLSLFSPSNTNYVAVTMYSEGPAQHESCSLKIGPAPTPPTPGAGNELLINPGFDRNSDWFNCGNAANYGIANGVLDMFGASSCVYQTVAATPNTTYNLVCDSTATAAFSNVTLSMLDSNYSTLVDDTALVNDRTVQPSVQLSLDSPSNTSYVAVTMYSEGPAIHESCSLIAGTAPPPTPAPTVQDSVIVSSSGSGNWSAVQPWPLIATSVANLPDGRVLAWPQGSGGSVKATIFDPVTGTFEDADNPVHDNYCAGLVTLSDGGILTAGGGGGIDRKKVSIFNGSTWQRSGDMANGHWYGTAVVDASDNVLVSLGTSANGKTSLILNNGTSKDLSGVNLVGTNETGTGLEEPHWYPALHLSPRGTIFHAGPTTQMHEINIAGNGTTTPKGNRNQDGVTDEVYRQWGNAIMIDEGKIMLNGGTPKDNDPGSLNTNVIVDINGTDPVVSKIAPMQYSRTFHSTVLLPSGEVMVVGGNGNGVNFSDAQARLVPEIYNPATNAWRNVAAMSVPRTYHSTAILLQDGRVLAAGGGLCGGCSVNHQDGQIYSPAYLFNNNGSLAARPVISSAPSNIGYNQSFNVSITGSGASNIARFTMIRFSASTHHINTDLRQDALAFTNQGGGSYTVISHSNKNVVTPGYYYLFAVNSDGVPAIAKIIRIGANTSSLQWQEPSQGSRLKQVSATSASQAWGVNANDDVYHSSNGGSSWQRPNQNFKLKYVSAIDSNNAWGVNASDQIFRTSNGGSTWQQTSGSLKQVSAIDANNAWGVNANNNVYRTSNGGTTWQGVSGSFKQVSAIDANNAWAVNTNDQVYRTSDGGNTWQQPNQGARLKQISAISASQAWGVNGNDNIYKTTNGGTSWQTVASSLKHVSALDLNQAWGVDANDKIYRRVY